MKHHLAFAFVSLLLACSSHDKELPNQQAADDLGFTPASPHTISANNALLQELPFDDKQDFADAHKGFIAAPESLRVKNQQGDTIWDMPAFNFMQGEAPPTTNPSLWRQAQLNNVHGLFEVTEGIYQLRGFDLANMTLIEGKKGWIVVDPLTTAETAQTALAFANQQLGARPISTILFTHSHMDHFGGALGLLSQSDLLANTIDIVAPSGFMHEATSENVIAGTAMSRRALYMYGKQLPKSARGMIGVGLGKEPAFGKFGILAPTIHISENNSTMMLDGIEFEFQIVSGTEAPAEFTFYLPEQKAYCGAELVSKTMHNLYTLRGAKVRDAIKWSTAIDQAIQQNQNSQVYFGSHHWPVWGQQAINDFLESQRDTYKYIHDQSVRMLNEGYTAKEIAEDITLPPSLSNTFSSRGYYGTAKHNAKAVYQGYLGWYDANPANLDPLPSRQSAEKYINLMGGSEAVLAHAQNAYDQGEYRWVAELLNHLVMAVPNHKAGKSLLARTYDQLGYQTESGPWRNAYLSAAYELRHGAPKKGIDLRAMKDILMNSPVENFLLSMATRIKGPEAFDKHYIININFTDLKQNFVLELKNAVLHHHAAEKSVNADASLNISHEMFIDLVIGQAGASDILFSDELSIEGSKIDLVSFLSLLSKPKGVFNIVTP